MSCGVTDWVITSWFVVLIVSYLGVVLVFLRNWCTGRL